MLPLTFIKKVHFFGGNAHFRDIYIGKKEKFTTYDKSKRGVRR